MDLSYHRKAGKSSRRNSANFKNDFMAVSDSPCYTEKKSNKEETRCVIHGGASWPPCWP